MVSVTQGSWGFLDTLLGDVASRLPANGTRGVMNSFCINPGRLRNKDVGTKGAGWAGMWRHRGHRCGGLSMESWSQNSIGVLWEREWMPGDPHVGRKVSGAPSASGSDCLASAKLNQIEEEVGEEPASCLQPRCSDIPMYFHQGELERSLGQGDTVLLKEQGHTSASIAHGQEQDSPGRRSHQNQVRSCSFLFCFSGYFTFSLLKMLIPAELPERAAACKQIWASEKRL